jgi:hypothetical protein
MADSYIQARDRVAGEYTFTIRNKAGTIVTALTSLTLSLWIKGTPTPTYINSRNKQNVLNLNNVTFAGGVVTWSMQPADNALAGDADEIHLALFEWVATGEDDFHEIEISVPNTRVRP